MSAGEARGVRRAQLFGLVVLLSMPSVVGAQNGEDTTFLSGIRGVEVSEGHMVVVDASGQLGSIPIPQGDIGDRNTAVGGFTLLDNKGSQNTAIGFRALRRNTEGSGNTAVGARSLRQNEIGTENTAVGVRALFANVKGSSNTAVGANALSENVSGGSNTAVGAGALLSNSTGLLNTAVGARALELNTTGIESTAIGFRALLSNSTGKFNTAISPRALELNTSGEQNVAIGLRAGSFNETGNRNIFIGSQAGANSKYVDANNQLVIHGNASSNPLIEGDFRERTLRINGDFSATTVSELSDARLKTNIEPLDHALSTVLRLQGQRFNWRREEYPEHGFTDERDLGLIAQAVEMVLPELVRENRDGYKTIEYGKLTAVLVEAMKEQQAHIAAQQDQIAALMSRVQEIELRDSRTERLASTPSVGTLSQPPDRSSAVDGSILCPEGSNGEEGAWLAN